MKFLILLFCICLTACGTISPNYPIAHEISFGTDGVRDAGVKGQVINVKTGVHMILLSASDREKFNNDIVKYGNLFNPPLIKDFGVIPYKNYFAFRNDALVDFIIMEKLK